MQVGAEIAILEQEVESRHTAELAQVAAEDMSTSSGTAAGSSENGVSSSGTVPGSSENGIVEEGMGRMNTKDGQEEGGVAEGGVSAMAKKSKAQKRKVCIVAIGNYSITVHDFNSPAPYLEILFEILKFYVKS